MFECVLGHRRIGTTVQNRMILSKAPRQRGMYHLPSN